jgi:hypothetical protein
VGISATGAMAGPANALSNAVICSPANGTVGRYYFANASFEGIVPDSDPGTINMACTQAGGVTIMTWTRDLNNGNPTDAQIATTGPTNVMWAIGKSNGEAGAGLVLEHALTVGW